MKKSSRFYLKYNPDNRWSFWTGKWWSLCSEISGQFTPKLGGQFDRLFHVKSNKVIGNLKPENTYKVKVKYSINYLQRRHKVDKDSLEHIETIYLNSVLDKELMEDAYNNLKKVIKKEEMKMTDITGLKFLARWQEEIQKSYEKTSNFKNFPKGYPKVITSE
ncbi:hypothetical protein [Chryseobacterium vrystaatense]|nr:hypothetical protein [Chryseobacterium vrystaatense]